MARYLPNRNGSSVSSDWNSSKYRDTGNCFYQRVALNPTPGKWGGIVLCFPH
jgi:hypothetical protein